MFSFSGGLIFCFCLDSRHESSGRAWDPHTLYEAAAVPGGHLDLIHVGCFPAGQRAVGFLLLFLFTAAFHILLPSQNGINGFCRSPSLSQLLGRPGFESAASAAAQAEAAEEEDVPHDQSKTEENPAAGADVRFCSDCSRRSTELLIGRRFQSWRWRCLDPQTSQASICSLELCSSVQNQFYKNTRPARPRPHRVTRLRIASTPPPAGG